MTTGQCCSYCSEEEEKIQRARKVYRNYHTASMLPLLLSSALLLLLLPSTSSCLEHPRAIRVARSPLDGHRRTQVSERDPRVVFPGRQSSDNDDEGQRPVYRGRRHKEGGGSGGGILSNRYDGGRWRQQHNSNNNGGNRRRTNNYWSRVKPSKEEKRIIRQQNE